MKLATLVFGLLASGYGYAQTTYVCTTNCYCEYTGGGYTPGYLRTQTSGSPDQAETSLRTRCRLECSGFAGYLISTPLNCERRQFQEDANELE